MTMLDKHELRKIHILEDMPDEMLDMIRSVAELKIFSGDTLLFEENQELDTFYMVLAGTVLLEIKLSEDVTLALGSVQPGYCFGVSTFIPGATSASAAVCAESCELISCSGAKLMAAFEQNTELGYYFMHRIVRAFKTRMDQRTRLFLKSMENRPELAHLFETYDYLAPKI
jgi:CRP-like cAMP-binding protein